MLSDPTELPGGAERLRRLGSRRAVSRRVLDDDLGTSDEAWAQAHEKELRAHPRPQQGGALHVRAGAPAGGVADAGRRPKSSLDDALKTWDVCMQVKAFVTDGDISARATERVRDTLLESGDIMAFDAGSAPMSICASPNRRRA